MFRNYLIEEQDDLLSFKQDFFLHPKYWENLKNINIFEWKTFQFDKKDRKKISVSLGLYNLIINPFAMAHPQRYLCSIGKEEKSLRDRFIDYLRHAKVLKIKTGLGMGGKGQGLGKRFGLGADLPETLLA
ncbi:MAG: hypothetical protein MUF15_26645, partial [Acidobacteria bacterium]|nr:hypothetical protein [Acidobacteriota bacterium]